MQSSNLLHQVIETLREGVAIADERGRLVYANKALGQLLGYEQEHLVGQPWTMLFSEKVSGEPKVGQEKEPGGKVASGGTASPYEICLQHRDGTMVPVLACSYPLSDGDRDLGILSAFTDLRDLRHLQARVGQLEKVALVGQNGLSVIHELNNSLTILLLQAQLLSRRREPSTPRFDESLTIIQDQVRRMRQMVDNLRTFADPYQLHLEMTDVNALIRQTLDLQEQQLRMDGIQVATDLEAGLPATKADPYKLQQVFVNLVNNARQAITAVQASGSLVIRSECRFGDGDASARIQIRFADNGPGIPADVMPHIFEPFFTTKEHGQGMGLGLSICEQIVMKHGGRVWAENNDNGGASFVLELPVTGQTASDKVPPPDWSHLQQSPTAVFHTLRSNHHILIVDDEPSVAQSVEEILRQAGFEVTTATEAQQALSLLEQNRYDVIISDLTMPQMDGQQFWQAVTERHPDLANRIIFSSGDSSSQRARAFLEDCGCSWVEKPFKPEGFLRLIQQTLPNKPEVCPSSAQENVACMSRFS